IAAEIEDLQDLIYKQVERNNSLEDYQDYVERYPDSSNIRDARAKIIELESAQARQMEIEQAQRRTPFPTMEEVEVNESGQMASSPIEDTAVSQKEMESTGFQASPQGEEAKDSMPTPKEEALMVDPQPAKTVGTEMTQAPAAVSAPVTETMETPPPVKETESPPPQEMPTEKPQAMAMDTTPAPPPPAATVAPPPPAKTEDVTSEFLQKKITELKRKVARAPMPSSGLTGGRKIKVATRESPLNVRLVPSIRGKIIGQAEKGSILPVLREKGKWYQVEYDKGKIGWISKLFSELVE
ncbi:MAG: SH3 domain-containing protein, partial [Nitrospinales bacterium]